MKRANAKRKAERFRKTFGPEGFSDFVRSLPCIVCGKRGRIAVHHDPTRGAGGRWVDTSPLCKSDGEYSEGCHERRHRVGVETFWAEAGMDYAEAARLTQTKWLAR